MTTRKSLKLAHCDDSVKVRVIQSGDGWRIEVAGDYLDQSKYGDCFGTGDTQEDAERSFRASAARRDRDYMAGRVD